jgi:hypothetical protein
MNDISFKNHERTLEKIKFLFFNTLYLWTTALVSPLAINYRDFSFLLYLFIYFLFLLLLAWWVFLVHFICTWRRLMHQSH